MYRSLRHFKYKHYILSEAGIAYFLSLICSYFCTFAESDKVRFKRYVISEVHLTDNNEI